jgi:putative DNA primase/helicase
LDKPLIAGGTPAVKDAAALIEALGGDPHSGMCRCVAHDDATPSLRISENANGKVLVHCFAGCSQAEVLTALKASGLWPSNRQTYVPTPHWKKTAPVKKEDTTEFARRILRAAAESDLKPAAYLRGRGITLMPQAVSLISHVTASKIGLRRFPHMVVPITNGRELVGAQTTALTMDAKEKVVGNKSARLTYGTLKGNYVVLVAPEPDRPLIIGEGTETVLSAMQITDLPGIAALAAWNLPKITPPPAHEYILAADNDPAGLSGARALAAKLVRAGHVVRLAVPPEPQSDWNDMLIKKGE